MLWTCNSHTMDIEFICLNPNCSETKISCFQCIQNGNHISHLKDVKKIENFYELYSQESNDNTILLNKFGLLIDKIKHQFQIIIDGIQLKYHKTESQYQNMNTEQINHLAFSFIEWKKDMDFIENTISGSINQLLESINLCINTLKLQQNKINSLNIQQEQKILKYELINSIKDDDIFAFAFDNVSSLIIAGYSSSTIKVFEFNQGNLNSLQELNDHNSFIYCLYFMKKSQCFLSGSGDKQIILWSINQNKQFFCKQKLQGHNDSINCLIMSENEELIVSGSSDKTIRFWAKNSQSSWNCQQILSVHKNPVNSISLNQSSTQLISCAQNENFIIISQQQVDRLFWEVISTIQVDQWGYRLCYINNLMFTFQPKSKEQMYIYEIDDKKGQFKKTKELTIKAGHCSMYFPQQYIKSKSILLNKNGNHVNLIRKLENQEFATEQSIDFGTQYIYGTMSQDGDYLITYDDQTREIQIRKIFQ
ncbi:unnamed protein product [Paramecium primaurelia]|uniref:WD domain, G-beta repeat protein n=1 Tax=Paramecium primaurelia TaxID=5886 RepID=A0A8S1QKC2_PARPR|nr:unnamed protein product [Paramecium primaurelia]CAD8114857.1 unnamed protein product [Paramecium primaurelia]